MYVGHLRDAVKLLRRSVTKIFGQFLSTCWVFYFVLSPLIPYFCVCVCVSLSLSLSLSLPLSLSFSLSLSPSLSPSVCPSLYLSLSFCLCLCVSLSASHSLSLSQCVSFAVFLCPPPPPLCSCLFPPSPQPPVLFRELTWAVAVIWQMFYIYVYCIPYRLCVCVLVNICPDITIMIDWA